MTELLAVDGPWKGEMVDFGYAPMKGDWVSLSLPLNPIEGPGVEAYRYDAVRAGPVLVCRVSHRQTYRAEPVDVADSPDARVERFMEAIRSGKIRIDGDTLIGVVK